MVESTAQKSLMTITTNMGLDLRIKSLIPLNSMGGLEDKPKKILEVQMLVVFSNEGLLTVCYLINKSPTDALDGDIQKECGVEGKLLHSFECVWLQGI